MRRKISRELQESSATRFLREKSFGSSLGGFDLKVRVARAKHADDEVSLSARQRKYELRPYVVELSINRDRRSTNSDAGLFTATRGSAEIEDAPFQNRYVRSDAIRGNKADGKSSAVIVSAPSMRVGARAKWRAVRESSCRSHLATCLRHWNHLRSNRPRRSRRNDRSSAA